MDEHETAIHWSCVIQEVTKSIDPTGYSTPVEYGAAVVDAASEIWAWHGRVFGSAPTNAARATAPQQPAADVPYGEEAPPHPGPSSGPPAPPICGRGANDTQGCGQEMEYFSGTNDKGDDYAGYRCPNQKKTIDPAEQAAEKVRHPVQWL